MKQENQKSSEELKQKLDYLFENYKNPDFDNSSIVERTLVKIRRERIRHRVHLLWVSSFSLAASVFIGFVIHYLLGLSSDLTDTDIRQLANSMPASECEEVILVTPKERLQLSKNAFVQYDAQGKMQVNGEETIKEEYSDKELEYSQLIVPAGKRVRLQLADGTHLMLNSMSRVVYPQRFDEKERRIYAEGEIYLEVAPDKARPFIVESSDFDLKVLGTKFNISTYDALKETQIVLVEGSVEVTGTDKHKAVLKPNELLSLEEGKIVDCRSVDVADYISWTKGWIHFKGDDLSEVISRLQIYYGVSISCDKSLSNERIYGKLELKENLDDMLYNIQQIIPFKIHSSAEGGIELIK